jgi:hypothetical protein
MSELTLQELIDDRLYTRLHWLQNVEAHMHLGTFTSSTTVKFPYANWVSTVTPIFYKNGTIFTPDSYSTSTGVMTHAGLHAGDDIHCSYTFMYFTNAELENNYKLAMAKANNTAPASGFTFDSYPTDWEQFLTDYAYKNCLQAILTDLMTWRAKFIWADPVGLAGVVQGIVMSIETELSAMLKTLKGRRFLSPKSISTGRFRLPAIVSDSTWMNAVVRKN